jgi:hypothetical protein
MATSGGRSAARPAWVQVVAIVAVVAILLSFVAGLVGALL